MCGIAGILVTEGNPDEKAIHSLAASLAHRGPDGSGRFGYKKTVVLHKRLSIIDLESILPVEWFGKNNDFAYQQLDKIDVGLAVQKKFQSPKWYSQYIKNLQLDSLPPDKIINSNVNKI